MGFAVISARAHIIVRCSVDDFAEILETLKRERTPLQLKERVAALRRDRRRNSKP